MKIDWKKKLASRKLWAALGALAVAVCALFGIDELTTEKLAAVISALGVLATYIITEGYLDGKSMEK